MLKKLIAGRTYGGRTFGSGESNLQGAGSGSGGSGGSGSGGSGGGSGGGGGPVDPPATGNAYQLQVDDSTTSTIQIAFNPYRLAADSVNIYVDDVIKGNVNGSLDTFTIPDLSEGQTVAIKIAPVVNGQEGDISNEIFATTARSLGTERMNIIGLSVTSNVTVANQQKRFRWAYVEDYGSAAAFVETLIMVRRYDTPDIVGKYAHHKASEDLEGRRGYEVLAPQSTGQNNKLKYYFDYQVPADAGAVYRVFVAGVNANGQAADWHAGPIFTEGESWRPGASVRPVWYTSDPGTGTVTLIEGGVRTPVADWATAIATANPANFTQEGDGIEVDGIVRTLSPTGDNYLKFSGDRWRKGWIFGKTGAHVDSVRGSVVVSGTWTDEGGGRYSIPIPVEFNVAVAPNYKGNSLWCNELPLRQAGTPSSSADFHTTQVGYQYWGNELFGMTPATMTEQTFYWDKDNNKIWVRLPGGADPSSYTFEAGLAVNLVTGVDSTTPPDQMRNHWGIRDLTLAHSNGSGLVGQVKETVGTGREGWILHDIAILGGCTRSLGHYSTNSLLHNVLVDGGNRMTILAQNTGPEFGWTGNDQAPQMRTLFEYVTVSAGNVSQYFPTNHIGNKRIPGHRYYHTRRGYVGPRTSTTFPGFELNCLTMGEWFDVGFNSNIVEENFYYKLPFSWYVEITPEDIMQRVCDWSADNRNNMTIGLSEKYRILISETQNGKTLAAYISSSHRALAGHNTVLDGTTGIFAGGDSRTINEPNYSSVAETDDASVHGNICRVLPNEWANYHIQGSAFTNQISMDDNYHDTEFSWYDGFGKSIDQTAMKAAGFGLRDQVGVVVYQDPANLDFRVTGGPNNAVDYGAAVPPPNEFLY